MCIGSLRLDASSVLRPEFLLVGNGLDAASDLIVRGNERVLGARLADAEFFLGVDRRQTSESRREALARVTFAEVSAVSGPLRSNRADQPSASRSALSG